MWAKGRLVDIIIISSAHSKCSKDKRVMFIMFFVRQRAFSMHLWYNNLKSIFWKPKSHLVQCSLRYRVILYLEKIFVLGKNAEDMSEGGQGWRQLVLQHISVFLLQYTARQLNFNKLHHRLQVWFGSCHPQNDGVSITKPIQGEAHTHRDASKLKKQWMKERLSTVSYQIADWSPVFLNLEDIMY